VGDGGVAVADRGSGIPEAELPLVFDRFHRADEARALPGSGLGLSIVRDVARRHGGDAFARNREGGGAVVGFTLAR
jgi:two-component system sensor histidine kinase MprB